MLILIGVQNKENHLKDYALALAISKVKSKLEQYRDKLIEESINECQCSHCRITYKIEEIKDLDEED